MMTLTNPASTSDQLQTYFSKKLLPRALQELTYDQVCAKFPFPQNAGATTIRMFRKQAGAASNVSSLTEGVPLAVDNEIAFDYVEATIAQYGQRYRISDVRSQVAIFDTLEQSIDSLGENAALHADQVIRNEIVSGITGSGYKRYSGNATTFNGLVALTNAQGKMVLTDLLDAMTQLGIARAPKKNGEYVAIVPLQIVRDLLTDTNFVNKAVYQNSSDIMKGEVGKWYGVRILTDTVPWREANTNGTEGTFSASGPIFTSVVTGTDGFGCPIMAGGSPFSPKVIVVDKPDKLDALNQYIIVGAKTY